MRCRGFYNSLCREAPQVMFFFRTGSWKVEHETGQWDKQHEPCNGACWKNHPCCYCCWVGLVERAGIPVSPVPGTQKKEANWLSERKLPNEWPNQELIVESENKDTSMNHKESYVLFGHLNGVRPHHPLGRKKARKFRGSDSRGVLLQGQPQDHPVISPGKLSNH